MSRKKDSGEELWNFASLDCRSTNSICRGRGVVHGKGKGGGKQLEGRSQWPDSCETGGKCLRQKGDDITTSVRFHVIMCTSSKRGKCSN